MLATQSIQWGDVASWVGGLATAGGFVFAGFQLRLIRQQAKKDRAVEIEGVSVSWRAPIAKHDKLQNGSPCDWWSFTFVAQIPVACQLKTLL